MDNNFNMTFEESQDYISRRGFDIPWNDCDVFVDEREITKTVGNVLKWADENPSSRCYTKQQLRDMGFAFTTNGDIVTPADMGDMAERFVKYERKKTHDKIEEWLKENFFNSHEIDCYGCFLEETEVTSSFDTVEEMMESFHKIMEEQYGKIR